MTEYSHIYYVVTCFSFLGCVRRGSFAETQDNAMLLSEEQQEPLAKAAVTVYASMSNAGCCFFSQTIATKVRLPQIKQLYTDVLIYNSAGDSGKWPLLEAAANFYHMGGELRVTEVEWVDYLPMAWLVRHCGTHMQSDTWRPSQDDHKFRA